MISHSRVRKVARLLRGASLCLLILLGVVFTIQPETEIILRSRPLTDSKMSFSTGHSFVDFFFRQRLRGRFDPDSILQCDILIDTKVGHYRVETDGRFDLPAYRDVDFFVSHAEKGAPPPQISDVTLHRKLLPGGWAALFCLALLVLYFHSLSARELSPKQFLDRITLLVSLGISFAITSALLQIIYPLVHRQEPWHLFPPNLNQAFDIYPGVTPGLPEGRVRFKTNSEGIRARERDLENWDSVTSILAIGASTTVGLYLGEGHHWPALLESRLRETGDGDFWVGNAGKAGYNTAALQIVAENYVPRIKPKYLVLLTGFNEGVVPNVGRAGARPAGGRSDLGRNWKRFARKFVVARLAYTLLFDRRALSPHDVDLRGSNVWYVAARDRLQRQALRSPPHDRDWDDLDLTLFEQHIRNIFRTAQRTGTKLVLCTQPTIYKEDMPQEELDLLWMAGNYTPRSKRARMNVINDRIRQLANEWSIPVVDLDRKLPRTSEVFYDDCHFNRRGAQLVAEEIYDFFVAELERRPKL